MTVQEAYLRSFPHSFGAFLQLFDYGQELYDGHDYIDLLPSLAAQNNEQVGGLLIGLCKDARWAGDAPNYLQNATASYASEHTKTFARLLKQLPPAKQNHVVTFLTDGIENFSAYQQYQPIIDHLRRLGEE